MHCVCILYVNPASHIIASGWREGKTAVLFSTLNQTSFTGGNRTVCASVCVCVCVCVCVQYREVQQCSGWGSNLKVFILGV